MRYVYGPISSRRLGQSLGVDPIPLKTCNWNCVYCQLGRTHHPTLERALYTPTDDVLAEVHHALAEGPRVDWVTLAGSGEPTLHAELGRIVRGVAALEGPPVAVITNGSLLGDPAVQDDLQLADAVMPTVSAGTERLYRQLHRPHHSLGFEAFIEGLRSFRAVYSGRLWVEVMLVAGMNDSAEALRSIRRALERIEPDAVHLNVPSRPPAETRVQGPTPEAVQRALAILGERAHVVAPRDGRLEILGDDPVDAVLAVLRRHPVSERELLDALRHRDAAASDTLRALSTSGRAVRLERTGGAWWSVPEARREEAHSST